MKKIKLPAEVELDLVLIGIGVRGIVEEDRSSSSYDKMILRRLAEKGFTQIILGGFQINPLVTTCRHDIPWGHCETCALLKARRNERDMRRHVALDGTTYYDRQDDFYSGHVPGRGLLRTQVCAAPDYQGWYYYGRG